MFLFRPMELKDLQPVLASDNLKALLTVPPMGEKWGMVLEEEGLLKGGATGYCETDADGQKRAVVQAILFEPEMDLLPIRDGMLRSIVNKADLMEAYELYCPQELMGNLYHAIGFRPDEKTGLMHLNTREFFSKGHHH